MAINKFGKLAKTLIAFVLTFAMSSCFPDLGNFEEEEDYYNTFGDITLLSKDFSSSTYDLRDDFYNEEIQEELEAAMDLDQYSYMFVEVTEDVIIDEFYLYVLSDTTATLTIDFLLCDKIPGKLRGYDDIPEEEPEEEKSFKYGNSRIGSSLKDDESSSEEEEEPPVDLEALYSTTLTVSEEWDSFDFMVNNLELKDGQFIGLRFVENTYIGKQNEAESINLAFTALLIHACDEGQEIEEEDFDEDDFEDGGDD